MGEVRENAASPSRLQALALVKGKQMTEEQLRTEWRKAKVDKRGKGRWGLRGSVEGKEGGREGVGKGGEGTMLGQR